MLFDFDINGRYEYPVIVLANPDFEELAIMEQIKNLKITPRFNAVSEVSFSIYQEYTGITLPYYNDILKNKLLHIIGFGWWLIDQVTETYDGTIPLKEVHAYSYEYTINYKGINLLDGTYKFYDLSKPQDTLLGKVMTVLKKWKIGHVDSELWNLYRTFDVPDATLYGFLMDEVSNTYEVIFEFDTENLLVNAYHPKNIVRDTDIMFTFDNVNKNIKIEELNTDIYTVLRVNGADNLSINLVNPLGDNRLFNFSYYKNEKWIGDKALIDKITRWETEIENQRVPYTNALKNLNNKNRELLKLQTELRDLQSQLNALEIVRKNLTDQPAEFKKQTNLVNAKNTEIKNKQTAIANKEKEIATAKTTLANINKKVAFDTYFTEAEKTKLDPYIIESVYTDENFIVTDEMKKSPDADGNSMILTTVGLKKFKDITASDTIIDENYIANQLLDQGKAVLEKCSQPSFTFTLDATNFLFIKKFKPFIKQIALGNLVNVELREGEWVYPILIEMSIDYDNPTSFQMVFGNRFRLSDAEWTFADLHNESIKTSSQVGTTLGVAAEPILNGSVSNMAKYMANSLIAANQEIQSTTDNEVSMGGYGIRLRKKDTKYASGYDPHQTWLNNNLICMTDDEWQTTKLAIGLISTSQNPNQKYYGVNAQVIFGNLLAGNQLIIQDGAPGKESTFIVDASGARLTNASFTLQTKDGKGKIILNPQNGIHIQTNKGSGMKDVFYVDTKGDLIANDIIANNITASGTFYATAGTVGGFKITKDRIYSTQTVSNPNSLCKDGSVVRSVDLRTNGSGNLGKLSWSGNNCRFDGDLYASAGTIGGFNISANSLTSVKTDSKGPLIQLNTNGTGRIGLMTWTTTSATFDGNIYAKNIGDKFTGGLVGDLFVGGSISDDKIDSLDGSKLWDGSVTDAKIDSLDAGKLYGDLNVWEGEVSISGVPAPSVNSSFGGGTLVDDLYMLQGRIEELEASINPQM